MPEQKPSFPGPGNFLLEMLEHPDPPQVDMQLPYPCRLKVAFGVEWWGPELEGPAPQWVPSHPFGQVRAYMCGILHGTQSKHLD